MAEPGSRRGRPHDAEGARKAILDAAEAVFAEHGFDGARIDAIAAAAGYNKSLIFQYYGDKLGLYDAVIRRTDWTTRDLQAQVFEFFEAGKAGLEPSEARSYLARFLDELFDYFVANPNILRIFMWETAEGWQTYAKIVSERDLDDVRRFEPIIRMLQADGLLRGDYNPLAQVLLVEFVYMYFQAALPAFQILLPGQDFSSPAALAAGKRFMREFVLRGMSAGDAQAGPQEQEVTPARDGGPPGRAGA